MVRLSNLQREGDFPRLWWLTATGGVIALFAIAILPVDSIERSLVARGTGLAASLVFLIAFARLPRAVRGVWFCMGAFLVLTALADLIYDFQTYLLEESAFPGMADILYLSTYGFAIAGLVMLSRKLNPGTNLTSWIDVSIMVVAAAGIVGAFIIGPVWTANDHMDMATLLSLVYPILDLVVLAALVRLLMIPHARNLSISLLTTSMGLFLGYDLVYNNQLLAEVWTPQSFMEVVWTAAMLCIPLAALSPGAERFESVDSARANEVTTTRQLFIGISVMAVPAIVLLQLALTGSLVLRWLVPVILVLLALVLIRLHLLLGVSQRQALALAELALTDPLTGLPNRRSWDEQLQVRAKSERTSSEVLSVALLDIDNFKVHIDAAGHQVGDLLLISAAIAWLGELEPGDLLARYGGDEFGVLIQRETLADSQSVLRKVLRATPAGLTVSVGAALVRSDEDPLEAVKRADSALYAAKSSGRDQIMMEQSITP